MNNDGLTAQAKLYDEVAAAIDWVWNHTRTRLNIILVSNGIPDVEARKIGITAGTDFHEALAAGPAGYGNNARIGTITRGRGYHGEFH